MSDDMHDVHCHRVACGVWIGESREPLEFSGVFRSAKEREHIPAPRYSWRCKGCGWTNIFRPASPVAVTGRDGRRIELKRGA